ncbi:Anti-sigma-K factor rskA [Rhodobacteraceae bacterium THAF1]|uniref:anti-sigma factor n=1 Tax=Palleronia sp. THAF1 TaxID=2587842 RepID=UPI000F3D7489|nr:anti-sigma factor [Palleronia sp. THAF1]QFU09258.1 Anti-sigma-K factor rskA [Palleronia sp. THAF1]VDC27386.1 Anti-sigma-K factor rskA [Rhodobacteraceae bacterium THAF1]
MSDGTDMTNGTDRENDDVLAAEYVLHLLSPAERQAVEDRLEVDGGFRARVASWSEDLVPLAEDIEPVAPPSGLRGKLASRIEPEPTMARTAGRSTSRRNWFRGFLSGGLALAAVVALLAVFLPQIDMQGVTGEQYAADVAAEDRSLLVSVRYDATDNVLLIRKDAGTVPEGRDLEVWLLTEDQPPHSVGVLPDGQDVRIDVSPFWGQRIPSGSFAVSNEPAGGSPTGLPTGEVIAVAPVSDA